MAKFLSCSSCSRWALIFWAIAERVVVVLDSLSARRDLAETLLVSLADFDFLLRLACSRMAPISWAFRIECQPEIPC